MRQRNYPDLNDIVNGGTTALLQPGLDAGIAKPGYLRLNLRVMTTPAQHLPAMNVRAAHAVRDTDDLPLLLPVNVVGRAGASRATVIGRHLPP